MLDRFILYVQPCCMLLGQHALSAVWYLKLVDKAAFVARITESRPERGHPSSPNSTSPTPGHDTHTVVAHD
eukprot:jgi/Chrzof1/8747/Cz03g23020.t1